MKTNSFTRFYFTSLMTVGAIIFSATIALAVPITATFSAGAEIVGDVAIVGQSDPNFGLIIPPTGAVPESYTLNPATGAVTANGATGSVGAGGVGTAGSLTLSGPADQTVVLSSPGSTTNCTLQGGGTPPGVVTFDAVTVDNGGVSTPIVTGANFLFPTGGENIALGVGGSLNVASSALGIYNCGFGILIDFL